MLVCEGDVYNYVTGVARCKGDVFMLQVLPGTEPSMSSLGALQFAAVGLESVNYGHLQQHMQRQVLSAL